MPRPPFLVVATALAMLSWLPPNCPAALVYADSLSAGPAPAFTVSRGQWSFSGDGLANTASGENRIFLDVLPDDTPAYEVSLTANLLTGSGWGLFFGAGLSANAVSGYTFQYDPGYGNGAYLLRRWQNDSESVLRAITAPLTHNCAHDFRFVIGPDSLEAYQDGVSVLSYSGNLAPAGDLLGFRTWSASRAVFTDLRVSTPGGGKEIPEPVAMLPLTAALVALAGRRRR